MNTNEHEERNKKSFWGNNWQWFVSMAIFIVFAAILIYNTMPQKQPDLQDLLDGLKKQTTTAKSPHIVKHETTTSRNVPLCDIWGRVVTQSVTTTETSSTTKTSNLPENYVYSKEDMDKILTTVALTARKDALDEYKENFSILLAILAVFGIAWPAIVAILQLRFNEGELKKIKEAEEKANAANTSVGQFDKKISSFENRMNNLFEAQLNMQNTTQELEVLKHNFYEELQTISGGLGVAYVLIDKTQTNGTDALFKIAFKMLFLQIKYACKSGTGIDSAIDLIVSLCKNLKIKKQVQLKDFILDEDWASLEVECITEEQKAKITQLRQDLLSSENGGNK